MSEKFWIDHSGTHYTGDCQLGDREATPEELKLILANVYGVSQDELKQLKLVEFEKLAAQMYVSGFISSATGEALLYDSTQEDQQMIEGLYNRAKEADWAITERFPGICPAGTVIIRARRSAEEPKIETLHDGETLIQLGRDLDSHIMRVKITHWQRQKEIILAKTYEELEKITW